MNWADGFWRYDVAEIARELQQLRVPADQARDAHGNSLLALAVKYSDPSEPQRTVAMLDMLFDSGCEWRHEPADHNLIVAACERALEPPVVNALLTWFYRQRSQHFASCLHHRVEVDDCLHWKDADHEALEWACQCSLSADTLRLLDAVVANNSHRPSLPLRALCAAIASKDEDWAMVVARQPSVEQAVRSIQVPTAWELAGANDIAPETLRWFLRSIENAVQRGMEAVWSRLDQLNHRAVGVASAFYVHVAKTHSLTRLSSGSSSSSSSSESSESSPSRKHCLTRVRSRRRAGVLFVATLGKRFVRDAAWEHARLLVMSRHRAMVEFAREAACRCPSEIGGGCSNHSVELEGQERVHPLLTVPDSVFALIMAFVPASVAVRETLEAFGKWTRWRPRRATGRKRLLK